MTTPSFAAEAAVQAIAGAASQETSFSLALSQDQKDIRDWVHGFAEDVIRPAAHEWDEREATPWPIIKEPAKIGLYGFEGLAQFFADPTGLGLPIVNEELFWGDAGIGMAIMGTGLAVAAIFGQGTGEQIGEWIPRCFGTIDDIKVAAFCASEPNAGSDVSGVRTMAKFDEPTNEWVLNGQKAWATNGGISDVHVVIASVDRELGSKGHAAFIVPMSEAKGIPQGTKVNSVTYQARAPRRVWVAWRVRRTVGAGCPLPSATAPVCRSSSALAHVVSESMDPSPVVLGGRRGDCTPVAAPNLSQALCDRGWDLEALRVV
jgi:alkylation response protein AidB-like acyl-CoA dehydrogenase